MRLVSVAPRSAPWMAPSIKPGGPRVLRQPLAQKAEVAEYGHQQIIEVVGDAAGELPQALHLLHFMDLSERRLPLARPLIHPTLKFDIGLGQGLSGAAPFGHVDIGADHADRPTRSVTEHFAPRCEPVDNAIA